MNAATQWQNLRIELVWASNAFLAESAKYPSDWDHNTPGFGTRGEHWWELNSLCMRLEQRIVFLEEMYGGHVTEPDYPTFTPIEALVWQARAAWAEVQINKATKNYAWSRSYDLQGEDATLEECHEWAFWQEVEDAAHDAMRRSQRRHDEACRALLVGA